MKKTLIALAALGVVGAASAQVSISGSMAVGLQTSVAGNGTNNTNAHFHITDADITFKGSEDLGGGLSASAQLGFSNESNRGGNPGVENNVLSLSGGFGTLTYADVLSGRAKMGGASLETDLSDYLGGYSNVEYFMYTTPDLGAGWKVGLQWAAGRSAVAANNILPPGDAAKYIVVTGSVAGASVYLDNNTSNSAEGWDLRVTYNLGGVDLAARVSKDKYTEFGLSMPMGAMTVAFNTVSQKLAAGDNKGSSIGLTYAMSKQTSLTVGYGTGSGAVNGNNYRVQLKKAF